MFTMTTILKNIDQHCIFISKEVIAFSKCYRFLDTPIRIEITLEGHSAEKQSKLNYANMSDLKNP